MTDFSKIDPLEPRTGQFHHSIRLLSPISFKVNLKNFFVESSDGVLEYSTRIRVQLEYHFLSTRTRNPRYSVGTRSRRSMYSVLGQKRRRVHKYIWPSLKAGIPGVNKEKREQNHIN